MCNDEEWHEMRMCYTFIIFPDDAVKILWNFFFYILVHHFIVFTGTCHVFHQGYAHIESKLTLACP